MGTFGYMTEGKSKTDQGPIVVGDKKLLWTYDLCCSKCMEKPRNVLGTPIVLMDEILKVELDSES